MKCAKFLYTTFTRKTFGSTNDIDVPGGLETATYLKENTDSGN